MNNREVMEAFGYYICANCHCDMPVEDFRDGDDTCRWCRRYDYDVHTAREEDADAQG